MPRLHTLRQLLQPVRVDVSALVESLAAMLRRTVEAAIRHSVPWLTLFAFSSENWKRPEDEVDDLMNLMRKFIKSDLEKFVANGVRLQIIGDYRVLAPDIVDLLEDALARTAKGTRTVAVALNYGAQQEIVRALWSRLFTSQFAVCRQSSK